MRGYQPTLDLLRNAVDLPKLARLYNVVERLGDDYVLQTMPMLAACCDPVLSGDCEDLDSPADDILDNSLIGNGVVSSTRDGPIEITNTERGRLQSAFFLYELYCRTFDHILFGNEAPISIQCRLFIERLRAWETEQLACLLLFFVSRLATYHRLTQRQFVADVHANALTDDDARDERNMRISSLENSVLDDLGGDWVTPKYHGFAGMASLGLEFLGELLDP